MKGETIRCTYNTLVRQLVDRIVSKTITCKFESYLKYKIIYE